MKILKYIWTVSLNLIVIGIIVAIFDTAYSSFETAVLASLVMIYIQIISFYGVWGRYTIESAELFDVKLEELRSIIKDTKPREFGEDDDEYSDEYKKELREEKASVKKHLSIQYYINVFFNFVIFIIAIGYLISAIQ